MKKCPYCAEEILDDAIVCRYCRRDLEPKPNPLIALLVLLRNFIGILQTIIILGGCGSLLVGSDILLSAAIQWFVIFLVIQLILLFLIYLLSNSKPAATIGVIFVVLVIAFIGYIIATSESPSSSTPPPTQRPTKIAIPTPTTYSYTKTPTSNPCTPATSIAGTFYAGRQLCVYGTVYANRTMSWGGSRIFFNSSESFFIVSSDWYFDVAVGDCVQAWGTVELSAEGIPYINVKDTLYTCN